MLASLFKKLFGPAKVFRDRRAATALTMALLAVPLFMSVGAAVDVARIATARTLLQASVDSAATAGASAWNMSQSPATATTVATTTFKGTASNLSIFGSYTTPTPSLACNGANAGTTTASSSACDYTGTNSTSYSSSLPAICVSTTNPYVYCVTVTASVTLNNWLAIHLLPQSLLTVTATAAHSLSTAISGKNVPPSPGFGSAGDVSGIYAYAVPMGSGNTPSFSSMPQANSACSSYSGVGPLAVTGLSSNDNASTCNFLFIALSTSAGTAGAGGSLTLSTNQPIAFSFINYTGANNYHSSTYSTPTTNLDVQVDSGSTTYYASGQSINTYTTTTTTYTCESGGTPTQITTYYNSSGTQPLACLSNDTVTHTTSSTSATGTVGSSTSCTTSFTSSSKTYCEVTTTVAVTVASTTLAGECPDHTLYGSLDPVSVDTTTGANNDGIPVSDSVNTYSSAYEVIGEPPTYETNHALIPFVSPFQTSTSVNGHTYKVKAVCPNYSTTSTQISAPISTAYAAVTGWTGLNIFSTAFPGQVYTDSAASPPEDTSGLYTSNTAIWMTSGTSDYYTPSIAGCTGAYSAYDGSVTPTSFDPWWNWVGSNSGNCSNESSTYKTASSTSMHADTTLPSGTTSYQPNYGNCTLIIQDLGTGGGSTPNVPVNSSNQALLPDYYLVVKNTAGTIVGFDPVYDGQSWYDLMPGVITSQLHAIDNRFTVSTTTANYITNTDTAAVYNSNGTIASYGFVPTQTKSYTLTSGTYSGDTVYSENPATTSSGKTANTYTEFHLPPETSYQCYNPANNGNSTALNGVNIAEGQGSSLAVTTTVGNNPTSPNAIDVVANPQLGAILCNSAEPETYALYWNDLGTYESDDLGYWNAITAFTCSVPGSTRSGGLATLSG